MRRYEPNIQSNPREWFGVWTPQGWRVHRMRWGAAERVTVQLSGDGKTTFFPEALVDPKLRRVAWRDDLHLHDDPFTDGGIYPCDPRVEYPTGRPRWAISHTLLAYPVADHNLYTHEYTWDPVHGHVQTHFRQHVALEAARTDAVDGLTVTVAHRPISSTIEGNVHYPLPNSAVRGVWDNPRKLGRNLYTRRVVAVMPMHNAVYGLPPRTPVVQCHGMYALDTEDPVDELFDADTGECLDPHRLAERCAIPIDHPRAAMLMPRWQEVPSTVYGGVISLPGENRVTVTPEHLALLRRRIGSRFEMGQAGYAAQKSWDGGSLDGTGYTANFDLNGDGVIDEADAEIFATYVGQSLRPNLYLHAYFGGDWLTTNACINPEHTPGTPVIADYEYGGGYDAQAGVVRLLDTPGPDRPVWIEYYHDAPAEPGENNITVHLYRES